MDWATDSIVQSAIMQQDKITLTTLELLENNNYL